MTTPARLAMLVALLSSAFALPVQAQPLPQSGRSPAVCSVGDIREPGIQGEVPAGATANYNCGVKLVGQLPIAGNVQGVGKCAYVRPNGGPTHPFDGPLYVVDVSNPAKPVQVASLPVQMGSESMRVVVNGQRAVLVSGSSVYDISDCLHPALMGEIKWPPIRLPGIPQRMLPHDIRINREGTKVYASFGLWEADISNLHDPKSWTVTDHRCEITAQVSGPWQGLHQAVMNAGTSLCADSAHPSPMGADNVLAASPLQAQLFWPQLSHSPDFNGDDSLLYIGDQAGGGSGIWSATAKVRIVDLKQTPLKIVGEFEGSGHGLDWFRNGGRDYVLNSNEGMHQAMPGIDTCRPYPRPDGLGWAFEAYVNDVTDPAHVQPASMLQIAINTPEYCQARKASGKNPWIAYHLIDNPFAPHFAAVNFGDAGLRIFDIRDPRKPVEVAYFNHGPLVHAQVGYYDAKRGLIYASGLDGFWVLQVEPQVRARLGL